MQKIDVLNKKFGKLTVIAEKGRNKRGFVLWMCKCDCGGSKVVTRNHLVNGFVKSCGCLNKGQATHGLSKTRFWNVWQHMRARCLNPNSSGYKNYGGRGIKITPSWSKFENFYADMFPTYFPTGSIERTDVNKGYSKENCTWIPRSQQPLNTRSNVRITYKGKTMILKAWARELGINYQTLRNRIVRYKMPIEKAFDKAMHYGNHYTKRKERESLNF